MSTKEQTQKNKQNNITHTTKQKRILHQKTTKQNNKK